VKYLEADIKLRDWFSRQASKTVADQELHVLWRISCCWWAHFEPEMYTTDTTVSTWNFNE